MTQRLEKLLNEKKFNKVEWLTNCYDWLGFVKDVCGLKNVQSVLESFANDWHVKPKDRAECLIFVYPKFEKQVQIVREQYRKKNKNFNFEKKSMMNLIWG